MLNANNDMSSLPVVTGDTVSTQLVSTSVNAAKPANEFVLYKSLEISGVMTPDDALRREYPVGVFDWVPGTAVGSIIGSLRFPEVLFTPYIRGKMAGFRYFSCSGVEVRIHIAGNPGTYGALLVSYDVAEGYDYDSQTVHDIVTASGYPHILVSANSTDTHKFIIPYMIPDTRLDLCKYRPSAIGDVDLYVMAPFTYAMSASVTPAKVTVYAKFLEPKVEMPTLTPMQAPTMSTNKVGLNVLF